MNLKSFKSDDWVKIYQGRWSFLTSSHFGDQYTKEIRFGKKPFVSKAIILLSKNNSSGWIMQKDRDVLGNYLSKQFLKSSNSAKIVVKKLEHEAKSFLKFIEQHENTVATKELYAEFWQRLLKYYHPHINVKYVVDYLNPNLLKKYLPVLQKARLVAEPVLNRTEDFLYSFVQILSKKTEYSSELLLCLTKKELKVYFDKNILPKKSDLKKRYRKSCFLHDNNSSIFFTGEAVTKVEKLLSLKPKKDFVKGMVAYKGKITGTVKVVFDPKKVKKFDSGNILVAGATRPEFLPLMNMAGAFVTDAGGILSHAAITAREMKKPCIIGTKIATKVFKDGDLVEVDANEGVVRKIK